MSVCTLLLNMLAFSVGAQQQSQKAQRLTEEQRILHVLNRLGFGARPGDVERVRALGIERYIEQQLYPEKIQDAVADAKVKNLPALQLSTPELFAKYPQPAALLRVLERRGQVPQELAPLVAARKKAEAAGNAPNAPGAAPAMQDKDAMAKLDGAAKEDDAQQNNAESRRALRDYLAKNGMRPPQALTAELQASRILRAVYSERQLQEVMVDFWTNHFNVFAGKAADRWLLISYDRDTIRPNTFAKFSDLLKATAESPAMLFFLDNFQSVSPNANLNGPRMNQRGGGLLGMLMGRGGGTARRNQQRQGDDNNNMPRPAQQQQRAKRGINENYARELMELHTLGVDGGYTQKDVQEVARCFTGWTIIDPRGYRSAALQEMGGRMNLDDRAGQFYFNARLHDDGEKMVLGHKIPAGGGIKDGEMVLDILAHHPSTARFIATKLARRFVSDEPSPALVSRVAAAFTKSDGDIRETLRALFASPEFNSAESYRAKIKTPFELAVSSIRTLGADTNGGPGVHQWIARMGEPLYMYQAPTGYPDTAENWVNTGALLERLNFGLALASNRIPGTRVDLARFNKNDSKEGANAEQVMSRFLEVIVQGDISAKTKATLLRQLREPLPVAPPQTATAATSMTDDDSAMMRPGGGGGGGRRGQQGQLVMADLSRTANPEAVKAVGLILGSPEFQRQ
ncbi:MAG TPA: DUF1800 domain-containing protein [Pyrinomonadaceae bacterium]|nr:DUF1800 domain-containing protein [Pyrinomonadaceae bacterium]